MHLFTIFIHKQLIGEMPILVWGAQAVQVLQFETFRTVHVSQEKPLSIDHNAILFYSGRKYEIFIRRTIILLLSAGILIGGIVGEDGIEQRAGGMYGVLVDPPPPSCMEMSASIIISASIISSILVVKPLFSGINIRL